MVVFHFLCLLLKVNNISPLQKREAGRGIASGFCVTTISLKTMGFFSVPSGPEAEAPGLVFSATYPWGSFAPSALRDLL